MDNKVRHFESVKNISDFLLSLKEELYAIEIPEEKLQEIKNYLESNGKDYHNLQAIIDVLISIPENEIIGRLLNQHHF